MLTNILSMPFAPERWVRYILDSKTNIGCWHQTPENNIEDVSYRKYRYRIKAEGRQKIRESQSVGFCHIEVVITFPVRGKAWRSMNWCWRRHFKVSSFWPQSEMKVKHYGWRLTTPCRTRYSIVLYYWTRRPHKRGATDVLLSPLTIRVTRKSKYRTFSSAPLKLTFKRWHDHISKYEFILDSHKNKALRVCALPRGALSHQLSPSAL